MPLIIAKLNQHRLHLLGLSSKGYSRFEGWWMGDIFWRGTISMMNRRANGHSSDFIKRQAKKIAKATSVPHSQALNTAAQDLGFTNWAHFINAAKKKSPIQEEGKLHGVKANNPGAPEFATLDRSFDPYRNLLVAATNKLLQKKRISLTLPDKASSDELDGHVFVKLFGFPSVILWEHIAYDEVRISVWWKYDHSLHPQANLSGNACENFGGSSPLANRVHYRKFVGVVASGWLERTDGKFIQGSDRKGIFDVYTRKGERALLEALPRHQPLGFGSEGKFYL
ncbi:hypothetical protein [Dyadobacter sp. 22481]|uniref:hypothetical protein n=1 Tax=Dyadobacter sp. 22481 TaxID=3453926 RepID=UPI003F82936D